MKPWEKNSTSQFLIWQIKCNFSFKNRIKQKKKKKKEKEKNTKNKENIERQSFSMCLNSFCSKLSGNVKKTALPVFQERITRYQVFSTESLHLGIRNMDWIMHYYINQG